MLCSGRTPPALADVRGGPLRAFLELKLGAEDALEAADED
jgi:hypothetical protein